MTANISTRTRAPRVTDKVQSAHSLSIVQVTSWSGCKKVCSYIHDEVVEKKATIELLMRAISLHDKRRKERGVSGRLFTLENLNELDGIRHEIHKYARRGPKELRSYNFSG